MTMRIVFLDPWEDYKPGDDAFIPRPKARVLCEEEKAVPYMTWADAEKKRKEEKPKKQPEPKKEPVKKAASPKRRYKKREKAVTVDDSATEK